MSRFWAAFNLSANPMILLQHDRVLAEANGAFLEAVGYSRAHALGCKLDVFVADDSRQRMKKNWWELLRTDRLNGEGELIRGDGRRVRVQFAAHREIVTGRDLVLGVVLELDRRPMRCGKAPVDGLAATLTRREREVVALVALGAAGARSPISCSSARRRSRRICETRCTSSTCTRRRSSSRSRSPGG
jgi:PAS domain S-box-containing protein